MATAEKFIQPAIKTYLAMQKDPFVLRIINIGGEMC